MNVFPVTPARQASRPSLRNLLGFLVGLAVFSLLAPPSVRAAAVVTKLYTDPTSRVTIEVVTPYEKLPSVGYMPARIRIGNQSGATRSWTITAESNGHYNRQQSRRWSGTFTVEHQAQSEFEVFLPMATLEEGRHQSPSLRLQAAGYGCMGSQQGISHARGHRSGRGGSGGVPIDFYRTVSDQLVAAIPYFSTNALPNSETLDVRLTMADASANYRAYHSVDQLWITAAEWRDLPPAKAQALAQWVRLGGVLVISMAAGDSAADLAALPPGVLSGSAGTGYGFGHIQPFRLGDGPLDEQRLTELEAGAITRQSQIAEAHHEKIWKLREAIGNLAYPVALILIFSIAFALLLGPVNLIIALRRRRPAQMLWTTPVFSLAAGILLSLVILLKDGTGGHGLRITLAFLDPTSRTLSTLQEQVSLTGVLLGNGFALDADTSITPLRTETRADQRSRLYRETEGYQSGDWFGSRSIQAQWLERAQPTRQRIELVAATSPDAAPTLQSAVGKPLHDVYYRDMQGHLWHTPVLNTGERKPLERVTPDAFSAWWRPRRDTVGFRMRMAFDRLESRRGMFYADVREADDFTIETLSAIRWQNRAVMLTGLVDIQGAP